MNRQPVQRAGGIFSLVLIIFLYCQPVQASGNGDRLFKASCAQCHGAQGQGFRKLYPPLTGSTVLAAQPSRLPCLIRFGIKGRFRTATGRLNLSMPGNPWLKEGELTELINYLRSRFTTSPAPSVTMEQVAGWLKGCP